MQTLRQQSQTHRIRSSRVQMSIVMWSSIFIDRRKFFINRCQMVVLHALFRLDMPKPAKHFGSNTGAVNSLICKLLADVCKDSLDAC